ncbi:hypothetical protein NIIDNTM18_46480 [Mycolicibacterium litorale]|uniref:Uncharacterized protein n=1 Tax=Mycolicibacterium litorale TaxID=758802 RepID=A0A6S6PFI2_9MYCO|nr:hypothetical protein NIIDNTM18_46480 [Mycolicibacterium litorale]
MRCAADAATENIATWVLALRMRTGMVSTVSWIVCCEVDERSREDPEAVVSVIRSI